MSKSKTTKRVAASELVDGMIMIIPAQRCVVRKCVDVNKHTPSLSKDILLVEVDATHGPFKGTSGKFVILSSETVEIEIKRHWFVRTVLWLLRERKT